MTDFSNKLDVITVVFNPRRYASRYRLYQNFAKDCADAGARLWTVEIAFGERPFEVTVSGEARHIQLRTHTELWYKENAINVALARLPYDAQYVAWIDADVKFARHDWASETVHLLQHYDILQLWSDAFDLGPQHQPFQHHQSFGYLFQETQLDEAGISEAYYGQVNINGPKFWHPGFAWAARRRALDDLGGLLDWPILGSADHHLAAALIGKVHLTHPHKDLTEYVKGLNAYQERALQLLKRNIGYLPGTLFHYWHGKKKDRRYQERWQILLNSQFDPTRHLKKDCQGLYVLDHQAPIKLRDEVRHYFALRNEDSIELPIEEVKL